MKFIFVRIDDCDPTINTVDGQLDERCFLAIEAETIGAAAIELGSMIVNNNGNATKFIAFAEVGSIDVTRGVAQPLPFRVGETYMDRDGAPVRIVAIDRKGGDQNRLVGLRWEALKDGKEYESVECFYPNGQYASTPGNYDLRPKFATAPADLSFTPINPQHEEKETQA
jgi:hypothetical protein